MSLQLRRQSYALSATLRTHIFTALDWLDLRGGR